MTAEDDPIVAAALARGFLTPEQLAEAVRAERELAAGGRSPGLRALLAQRFLRPEHVEALRGLAGAPGVTAASATPAARRGELAAGSSVGGFVIDRVLGKGGMGAVYEGHDPRTGGRVAIKVLLDTARPQALERFRREGIAQAAADRHKNVLRVLASGQQDGTPFLVMELAEGGDLQARLAGGPLPVAEAAGIVAALADGLAHVHARGILHRDLKPSNVMFDADGTPKLVDFGLAHLRDQDALTKTGELLGTPAYMAPEQADGARRSVDERTDVYGLGAILYHAVTGRRPFPGESLAELVRKVLVEQPAAPSSLVPGLPADVDRIVAKAMAKSSDERYPSAAALRDDLRRLLRGEDVEGRDPATARRRSRAVGAAGAASLVALALVGLWRATARPASEPATTSTSAPAPPRGALRPVHGEKAVTRLGWVTVEATLEGDALAGRVVVGDKVAVAAVRSDGPWRLVLRAPLAPGRNVVALEGQTSDGTWTRLAALHTERLAAFEPPPPEAVLDRKGRRLVLDEARERYVAHDGSILVYVPPGKFSMGSDLCVFPITLDQSRGEPQKTHVSKPVHEVTFTRGALIGRHEVSWRQFDAWVAAERPALPRLPTRPAGARDEHPAVNVLWPQAAAYCAWAGLELPSEAQWEFAARGPASRQYPWGDEPDPTRALVRGGPCAVDDESYDGASWVGALHLAGNAFEWVEDLFTPGYDAVITLVGNVDPRNPGQGEPPPEAARVIRGGSFVSGPNVIGQEGTPRWHAAFRYVVVGDLSHPGPDGARVLNRLWNDIGFRAALTLDERTVVAQPGD